MPFSLHSTELKVISIENVHIKLFGCSLHHNCYCLFVYFHFSLQEHSKLAEAIERETFLEHQRLISNSYKRTLRNLVFMLKNQADIRSKVSSGEITVTDFVKENRKT